MSIKSMVQELKEAAGYEVEVHRYLDQLIRVLDDIAHDPATRDELEYLPDDEEQLQALHGLRLTAARAVSMSPSMIQKHVYAYWQRAKPGVMRLELGQDVAEIIGNLMQVSVPHNEG